MVAENQNDGLPTRIGGEEVVDFVEQVAAHPGATEDELKKRLVNPKEFHAVRRACLYLGLIKEDSEGFRPTEVGKKIAYTKGQERRQILLRSVILAFEPYEIPVTKMIESHDEPFNITVDELQRQWAIRHGFEFSKDTMTRAATTFMKLLEYCDVGEYVMGRRGKPTRLELGDTGFEELSEAVTERKELRLNGDRQDTQEYTEEESRPKRRSKPSSEAPPSPSTEVASSPPQGEGYEYHESADKSVRLWIRPNPEALDYLKRLVRFFGPENATRKDEGRDTSKGRPKETLQEREQSTENPPESDRDSDDAHGRDEEA